MKTNPYAVLGATLGIAGTEVPLATLIAGVPLVALWFWGIASAGSWLTGNS